MFGHASLGGLQVDLLSGFRAVEVLSEADASVGWNVMNNAVQQIAVLSLPDAGVEEIFTSGPDQIIAGTLVPGGGRAARVDDGYVVTGRWRFGSGCLESHWLMGNFAPPEGTAPDGLDGVYRAVFRTEECAILDTWDVTGMRGTGSHDWSVDNVFVPDRRVVFVPGGGATNQWQHWPGTLYALPIHAVIGPHHSVIATGVARAGIDALYELAQAKVPRGRGGLLRELAHVQDWIGRAEAILGGGQAYRAQVLTDVWDTVSAGQPSSLDQRARCRLAGSHATDCARAAMDLVFRAAGTTATQEQHRLAHCWRDLQAIGQAGSVSPEWYPLAGRALLGLEPDRRLS